MTSAADFTVHIRLMSMGYSWDEASEMLRAWFEHEILTGRMTGDWAARLAASTPCRLSLASRMHAIRLVERIGEETFGRRRNIPELQPQVSSQNPRDGQRARGPADLREMGPQPFRGATASPNSRPSAAGPQRPAQSPSPEQPQSDEPAQDAGEAEAPVTDEEWEEWTREVMRSTRPDPRGDGSRD